MHVKSDTEAPTPTETELVEDGQSNRSLKLDKHRLPLVPQPSDSKDDPLVRYALYENEVIIIMSDI